MSKKSKKVVLVHGIFDTEAIFKKMKRALELKGFEVHCINLIPSSGSYGIESLAKQLDEFIKSISNNDHTLTLVGFSMGGLVSRYYLQRLDGIKSVHKLITISTPHYGSIISYFIYFLQSGKEMSVNSDFLNNLNNDVETLESVNPVSIWTKYDLAVIPRQNAVLEIGENYQIPSLAHQFIVNDTRTINLVIRQLLDNN